MKKIRSLSLFCRWRNLPHQTTCWLIPRPHCPHQLSPTAQLAPPLLSSRSSPHPPPAQRGIIVLHVCMLVFVKIDCNALNFKACLTEPIKQKINQKNTQKNKTNKKHERSPERKYQQQACFGYCDKGVVYLSTYNDKVHFLREVKVQWKLKELEEERKFGTRYFFKLFQLLNWTLILCDDY